MEGWGKGGRFLKFFREICLCMEVGCCKQDLVMGKVGACVMIRGELS